MIQPTDRYFCDSCGTGWTDEDLTECPKCGCIGPRIHTIPPEGVIKIKEWHNIFAKSWEGEYINVGTWLTTDRKIPEKDWIPHCHDGGETYECEGTQYLRSLEDRWELSRRCVNCIFRKKETESEW